MVRNFASTLVVVVCSVAALALHQEPPYASSEGEGDVTTCRVVKLYKKAIPQSSVDVDSIKALLHTTDLKTCVQACCRWGPTVCEYAWLFEGKCLAVSCPFNPAGCYPKSFSSYASQYVKMGYVDGGDDLKPISGPPETESTDGVEEVEPTDGDNQETEAPTKEPTRMPATSKWHHQRPTFLTKPVSTVSATTTTTTTTTTTPGPDVVMDTIALAELEDALNSTWEQTTPLTLKHPPSPHTLESSGGSVSTLNITTVDSSGLYEENTIGSTYVFVILSCFFGFLLLFFLFLACCYYIILRGRNQKTKKVSYTVVDHEDQVGKLADGKRSHQPPSSLVLSDSDTDEGGATFSMVGKTTPRDDARGIKHSSLASALLPI